MTDDSGPQTDNGYTRIANEILEDILSGGFNKRELLVLFSIIRKTYGFNKTSDEISAGQIAKMTGLAREHVARTINSLVIRGVVLKQSQRRSNVLSYQKKANLWGSAKTAHVPKQHTSSAKTVTSASAKTAHTKDNLKDILKDKAQAPVLPENVPFAKWLEWEQHRLEIKKRLTPSAITKQLTFLAKQPNPSAVIDASIMNGWTGLFEVKTNGKLNGSKKLSAIGRVLAAGQNEIDGQPVGQDDSNLWPRMDK